MAGKRAISLLLGLLAFGCQARVAQPPVELVAVKPGSPGGAFSRTPGITRVTPPASLEARLRVKETPLAVARRLLAIPTSWQQAQITLFSATASTGFDAAKHTATINAGAFSGVDVDGYRAASVTFPPLRPATDYRAELFLTNAAGAVLTTRLAGSQARTLTLAAGANVLDFTIAVNGQEATYQLIPGASLGGNVLVGNVVSTLAGDGTAGGADGLGALATFDKPDDVVVVDANTIYVSETDGARIRKITAAGAVTLLAGSGTPGYAEGAGALAQFDNPQGIGADAAGNVYVADMDNHRIRRVTPAGVVSTYAGTGVAGSTNAFRTAARFDRPTDVTSDPAGNLYVAEYYRHRIRKIDPAGNVTTFAGGTQGTDDGNGTAARFDGPDCIVADAVGYLYVSDSQNHRIRKIGADAEVTTLAGEDEGFADGQGSDAAFDDPYALAVGPDGVLYVADYDNFRIRRITPGGLVTTVAGGDEGFVDGPGPAARFRGMGGIAVDPAGIVYIGDTEGHRVRKLLWDGLNRVTEDDTIGVDTGIAADQPGVDHLDVRLSGACYGSPPAPVLVKRFTSAAASEWAVWAWDTSAFNTDDGANFSPTLFVGGAGLASLPGRLDFTAYDVYGRVVGEAAFDFAVFGRPDGTLRIQ